MALKLPARRFEKGDAFWQVYRDGVRYFIKWGTTGGRTKGTSVIRDSETDAIKKMDGKVRQKLKSGFSETKPDRALVPEPDPNAEVFEILGEREILGKRYAYESFGELPRTFRFVGPGSPFADYLLLSPDGKRGFWSAFKLDSHDESQAVALLSVLSERLEQALAIEIIDRFALSQPIGKLDSLYVCAPVLAYSAAAKYRLSHSLFYFFPGHRTEFIGDEHVAQAEARMDFMRTASLDRDPCPVIDMRYQALGKKAARSKGKEFLVYRDRDLWNTVRRFAEADPGSWLEVRNFEANCLKFVQQDGITIEGDDNAEVLDADTLRDRIRTFLWDGQ